MRYYPRIQLVTLQKIRKSVSQNSPLRGQDSIPGPPEYEAEEMPVSIVIARQDNVDNFVRGMCWTAHWTPLDL
jgi:hypothetical protein